MSPQKQPLTRAFQHQHAGEIAQAEAACLQIVRDDPQHHEAWNLLGILAFQTGKVGTALEYFDHAAATAPMVASYRSNRGAILQSLGRFAEAETEFRAALRINPDHADAHNNLGTVLRNLGRYDESAASYRRALELKPSNPETTNNLAALLADQGRADDALPLLQRLLELRPDYAEGFNNLGNVLSRLGRYDDAAMNVRRAVELKPTYAEAHHNLGIMLWHLGRYSEAEASCRRALELRPAYPDALNNLGNVLRAQGRLTEAEASYRRALELRPGDAEAHNYLGSVLREQGRYAESAASFQRALELRPDYPEAHSNLGNLYRDQGRFDEAAVGYRRAIALRPDFPEAHNNLALYLLVKGDYEHGWPEYEWRWRLKECKLPAYSQPLWDGSPLQGRPILLHSEQGLGDTIHFIRYAALVKQRGGTVYFHCPPALFSLLRTCPGIDRLIPAGIEPPPFDVHAPLLSLPRLFGTRVETIRAIPYLAAEPMFVDYWRERLVTVPGFKVGITWQGTPKFPGDRQRSVPLTQFEPPARVPGVALFSLQMGPGQEQIKALGAGQALGAGLPTPPFAITDLGSQFDPATFRDAAAVVQNLDLVVTVDTATAHLAGALGKPVWVALPIGPDWRWMLEREDTPWYPTMRLFRQRRPGDWDEVFARMAKVLAARCGEPGRVSAGSTSRR